MIAEWRTAGREVPAFAEELVDGRRRAASRHRSAAGDPRRGLDRCSAWRRWTGRSCGVGVYELLWRDDVPPSVAISEAVEAAAELSADDAKRFVNGVLGRIAREEGVA